MKLPLDRVKRYTLKNVTDIILKSSPVQNAGNEGVVTENKIKRANTSEVSTIVAYMIGTPDTELERFYGNNQELLINLRNDKNASIIRFLSRIRSTFWKNFLAIENEMKYECKNIDTIPYFNKEEIDKLTSWGIDVIKPNCSSESYLVHVSNLIEENIQKCKSLFPESINFRYIKSIFVIPQADNPDKMRSEYNKFKNDRSCYPFSMYIYWKPQKAGNILYNDNKFLKIIYAQNNETFEEYDRFTDASDDTKEIIKEYVDKANKVVIAVDCENSDPYKLLGVLQSLGSERLNSIEKIVLFDDYHTTFAWDYIAKYVNISVQHIEVERVMDKKSLVDIKMSVEVTKEIYENNVDSFLLCSSDSDFWGVISSHAKTNFLVLYEYEKCGSAIKTALSKRGIFHCAMDDFYMEKTAVFQDAVLKKILEMYLPNILNENAWELTKRIFAEAYITGSDQEMKRFYDKYMKTLRLSIDDDGRYCVEIKD